MSNHQQFETSLIDALVPDTGVRPDHWERLYPQRDLRAGAVVTRYAPSPTGEMHIGGIYVSMIAKSLSAASGGRFFVRIEDTDEARSSDATEAQFDEVLSYFDVASDEPPDFVPWGPYRQSSRVAIYHTYVRHLLELGRAYPCFCSRAELETVRSQQLDAKVTTGYYGVWAACASLDPSTVARKVDDGIPHTIRFRSPGSPDGRVGYEDAARGHIQQQDNLNDAVLLKSSGSRLPTYHLAHAIDDHLMRVNLVVRGDEWISSVPLHLQLFDAMSFEPPSYAHIAPLMKLVGKSRRKLSKRKDPEASVSYYLQSGYPAEAVLHYLRGLANSNLADKPRDEIRDMPIALEKLSSSGALVDSAKLNDISKDVIAEMDVVEVLGELTEWARQYDPELAKVVAAEKETVLAAVGIGRGPGSRQRKDLVRWSDFRGVYGLFFSGLHDYVTDPRDERFGGMQPKVVFELANDLASRYRPPADAAEAWFQQIRELAQSHRFALTNSEFRENPDGFIGRLKDVAGVVRVLLTGSERSPELDDVARVLGTDEVLARLRMLEDPT